MLERFKNLFGGGARRSELGAGTAPGGPARGEPGLTAGRQHGDPEVLDRPGDPRGGLQSEEYRHADPRDVTEEDGTVMSGPAGAPQEGLSVEERRQAGFGPAAQRAEDEHAGRADDSS